ncbi:MAG: SH3 domain-containing protein [Agathobacter sp.]|nr:SH3 domain-containing protein [Agathobacter sp.]
MKDFIEKVKQFFKELNGEKIKSFCIDKKNYIAVVALCAVFIVVLACLTDNNGKKKNEEVADSGADTQTQDTEISSDIVNNFVFDPEFEKDENDELKELLQKYYEAYVDASYDDLAKICYPITDSEQSYIAIMSNYYESVDNISYYSKSGATDGSYFVSVYNEIKFEGIDTLAPTLDFFYVQTDKDGKLYINNAYSVFNQSFLDTPVDNGIVTLINRYMSEPDFVKLQQDTQAKFNEAISSDKNLSKMMKTTLSNAIREWRANLLAMDSEKDTQKETEKETQKDTQKETEKETQKETQQESEKETQKETQKPSESEKTDDGNNESEVVQVKTIDIVNVRAAASADAELLGKLTEGVVLTKLGEEGEWTIVKYSGGKDGKGYIKTEFLKPVKKS